MARTWWLAQAVAWAGIVSLAQGAPSALDPNGKDRYREENVRLAQPNSGEQRVVFMGDSVTDGWVRIAPAFFMGRPYVGRGISAQTTRQMLARFEQDVLDLQPAVVVILAGTNDIAGNAGPYDPAATRANLSAMCELARAQGIGVVLSSVLPAADYPWRPGLAPAPKIVALNAYIAELAARTGTVYLDYYSAMADARGGLRAELSPDGVHPNEAGYAIMAPLAEKAIAQAVHAVPARRAPGAAPGAIAPGPGAPGAAAASGRRDGA
jgi:acyl-CoA thioesterase I